MKNTKIKIIVPFIALLAFAGLVNIAQAAVASINVSPASLTKNVGDSFTASVVLSPAGNTVYAVEGTVAFSNLNCKSITLSDGIMAQTAPTCASPRFVLGFTSGASSDKTLFTVSLNAPSAGTATVSLSGVKIVGAGVAITSTSVSGTYTISALPVVAPKLIATVVTPVVKPIAKKVVAPVSATNAVTPESIVAPVVVAETAPVEETKSNNQQAQVADVSSGLSGAWIIVLGLVLAVLFGGYIFFRRNKK